MKLLGAVIREVVEGIYNESTYLVIRGLAKDFGGHLFSEDDKVITLPKEKVLALMFLQVVDIDKVKVVVGDIGVEEFCEHWAEYISKNDDDLRKMAAGEFDTLNMKINYTINKFVKKRD